MESNDKLKIDSQDFEKIKDGIREYFTDKYFTPSIEDIRVGYECEYLFGGGQGIWTNGFGLNSTGFPSIQEIENFPEILRVPYLTKEQIEAEGWRVPENADSIGVPITKNGWKLYMEREERIITIEFGYETLYHGSCKDINTFRYICKLLGI